MPKLQFETVIVKNLTAHSRTLRDGAGDSVDVPAFAEAKVARKFVTWQPPSPSIFRILHDPHKAATKTFENDQPSLDV
jgi:hypothetical protein